MRFDIITVGDAVLDAFLETGVDEKGKDICFPVGEKLKADNMWFSVGGCGVNTGVGFAKFGLKTGFLGNIGKDDNAKHILSKLKEEKVSFLGRQVKEPTAYSVVLDSKKRNRTILTYKGAALTLSVKEINFSKLKTKWIYLAVRAGKTLETQTKLAKWAVKNYIKVACNPGGDVIKEHKKKLKSILKLCDVLILNKEEAESLVGKKELFEKIHKLGPRIVCITNESEGSEVSDNGSLYKIKARKVRVVERTGAGDAYTSGFIFGLINGSDIKKAMKIGALNAESVIQKRGATNGLLTLREIQKTENFK